ncbi:MerR family transcriptional regulator [Actinoplanes sp. KI2]|uniref:MerR family transcriptional regulator n=1 Tax=Actinoplanes sp. KI2 TaxID=2983315 RepID=UPI0021D5D78F|nr:MerR family transcriptional regulator [Actinoplanes sp. KI2]MCU7723913.1 MerR family transcriptional regulator [Actinoplanes sp. KI2]
MLSVGEVARRAGLTTKALRHYDRLGLFAPQVVSGDGYRWYAESQVATALTIARMRAMEVPLEVIRALLAGTGEDVARRLLSRHRATLQARDDRIRQALHSLDHLLEDERGAIMALSDPPPPSVADERDLARTLFNQTWTLLGKESRSPDEDERMIHMAHASRFHWENVGDDENRAIGEWQCSRVYATLGHGEAALYHARRCLTYAERPGTQAWLVASAYEGLARAQAAAGDLESARDSRDRAIALAEAVGNSEEREIVITDIDTLPIP